MLLSVFNTLIKEICDEQCVGRAFTSHSSARLILKTQIGILLYIFNSWYLFQLVVMRVDWHWRHFSKLCVAVWPGKGNIVFGLCIFDFHKILLNKIIFLFKLVYIFLIYSFGNVKGLLVNIESILAVIVMFDKQSHILHFTFT